VTNELALLFDKDYPAARLRFLTTAQRAGAKNTTYSHPILTAPHDSALCIDTARFGSLTASHLMIIFSGTHGLEGLAGSAVQSDFMSTLPRLPDHAAVLFVHSVNPYGVAHSSRTNEDNIDLNRNFVDHNSTVAKESAVEREVQQLLATCPLSFQTLDELPGKVGPLVEKYGAGPVINAVTAGQYTFPEGLNYGGVSASWSNTTLRSIIKEQAAAAKKVVFLDWHSGLGNFAEPCYLCFNSTTSPQYQQIHDWWGIEAAADASAFDSDAQPKYSGLLVQGLAEELAEGASSIQAVIEFGTYDNMVMVGALMVDRWLRFDAPQPLSNDDQALKTWMKERFYPPEAPWREAVINMARDIHRKTLEGLLARLANKLQYP